MPDKIEWVSVDTFVWDDTGQTYLIVEMLVNPLTIEYIEPAVHLTNDDAVPAMKLNFISGDRLFVKPDTDFIN